MDLKACKPHFYTWTEDQAGKGSLEISSALLHHLRSMDLTDKRVLRLFSDRCVPQNKNNIVLRTLIHYLETTETPITDILMCFPVRGHSYIPANRVFGRLEKNLRKHPTILFKEEYVNLCKQVGEVRELGKDWFLVDTKSLNVYYKDLQSVSNVKRIMIKVGIKPSGKKDIKGKGLEYYRFESDEERLVSLRKKGNRDLDKLVLQEIPLDHVITQEKRNDVKKLLETMFGVEWSSDKRFQSYKKLLSSDVPANVTEQRDYCDYLEQETCNLNI